MEHSMSVSVSELLEYGAKYAFRTLTTQIFLVQWERGKKERSWRVVWTGCLSVDWKSEFTGFLLDEATAEVSSWHLMRPCGGR